MVPASVRAEPAPASPAGHDGVVGHDLVPFDVNSAAQPKG